MFDLHVDVCQGTIRIPGLRRRQRCFFGYIERLKRKNNPEFEGVVTIRTKKLKEGIEISVVDNGMGIPEKIVDKIFQPFFTTKPAGQGTGLGLSLSYDIIKFHNGSLRVETKDGEGTTFIVLLPAQ